MGITAKLSGSNALKIKTGTGSGGAAGGGVTVSSAVVQTTTRSLSEIQDIDTTNAGNNSVLVYNTDTQKYEVKPLPAATIDEETIEEVLAQGNVNLDGGDF